MKRNQFAASSLESSSRTSRLAMFDSRRISRICWTIRNADLSRHSVPLLFHGLCPTNIWPSRDLVSRPQSPFGYASFILLVARGWSARSRGTGINQCSVRKLIQLAVLYHSRQIQWNTVSRCRGAEREGALVRDVDRQNNIRTNSCTWRYFLLMSYEMRNLAMHS